MTERKCPNHGWLHHEQWRVTDMGYLVCPECGEGLSSEVRR